MDTNSVSLALLFGVISSRHAGNALASHPTLEPFGSTGPVSGELVLSIW